MTLNRRQATKYLLIGSGSLITGTGIFFPKPVEAYTMGFSLRNFSTSGVLSRLRSLSGASTIPGALGNILDGQNISNSEINNTESSLIRSSDQTLRHQGFERSVTELASAGFGINRNLIWGRQRQEQLGQNVGFGFVQEQNNEITNARIAGPAMAAIHNAQLVLADQRVAPQETAGALLPVRTTFNNLDGWSTDNGRAAFSQFRTALGEVTIRYDILDGGRNGRIDVTVEAEEMPTRNITINLQFA